jgi:hypothetical protein
LPRLLASACGKQRAANSVRPTRTHHVELPHSGSVRVCITLVPTSAMARIGDEAAGAPTAARSGRTALAQD